MHVVATAGHVDHGKSSLVRALTGMEPDRWAEERRRGLTIDLGFAWTTLPSGRVVTFVDVPGHERFLANMLAGLGPAPVVCFVIAADEGWQAQSSDHRDAVAALGIQHGVVVITHADRTSTARSAEVLAEARAELAKTGLHDAPAVVVSSTAGTGLGHVRTALDHVLARVPASMYSGRLRLWVDRSFTITGAGTVVTGTLTLGTVAVGDRLHLLGRFATLRTAVRGLQSCGEPHTSVQPVDRVALNLRAIAPDEVRRGDVLVTPDAWPTSSVFDVRRMTGPPLTGSPAHLTVHAGTAAVPARLRPIDDNHGRLTVTWALPLVVGDRLVLRVPGSRRMLVGTQVLDADPPRLRRRRDGARRAAALSRMDSGGDLLGEVARRGAVSEHHLRRLGLVSAEQPTVPAEVSVIDGWWIHTPTYDAWQERLRAIVQEANRRDPLGPGLSRGATLDLVGLPDAALLDPVIHATGLEHNNGYIRLPGSRNDLGPVENAVIELEVRLSADPFHAPEVDDLAALNLGTRELAAAERVGRLLRLRDGIVLLPTAPARAMRELARLEQPFTTSQARQALGTTRRVAIPLLEYLDTRGWTRRLDAGHREVVPRADQPAK